MRVFPPVVAAALVLSGVAEPLGALPLLIGTPTPLNSTAASDFRSTSNALIGRDFEAALATDGGDLGRGMGLGNQLHG